MAEESAKGKDMIEKEPKRIGRVPDINLADGAGLETSKTKSPRIAIAAGIALGTLGGGAVVYKSLQPSEHVQPAPIVTEQPKQNGPKLETAQLTPWLTAENKPGSTLVTRPSTPSIERPLGIDPNIWSRLTDPEKKRLAENTARGRGSAAIEAGLETPTPVATEVSRVISPEDIARAEGEAAKPPTPPKSDQPLVPKTGIGAIDILINVINFGWDALHWIAGLGVLFVLWRSKARLLSLAWWIVKLPFRAIGFVCGLIMRGLGRGPSGSRATSGSETTIVDDFYSK